MAIANLIIISILMMVPSVMLGFFFWEIIIITGVLLPDNIPTRVGMSFYSLLFPIAPGVKSYKESVSRRKDILKEYFSSDNFLPLLSSKY
jgi:hypothetical protein